MMKRLKTLALSLVILGLMSACSTTHNNTQSLRTAIEQLLLSEAVMTSLPQQTKTSLPIPLGTKVFIDTLGISLDQGIVRHAMSRWLGQQGYLVQDDKEKATYRVNVIVESLGTEYADTFFGIPPIQGGLIPISTPELAIYKAQYQTGYVKFHFDIFEHPSGRFVQSTAPFLAEKYYNDYTLFFLFGFNKTDLMAPPQLGTMRRKTND
jgi:hypothetical protein